MRSARISLFHGSNQPFEIMNVALGHLMQVKFLLGLTLLLFVDLICILSLGGEHLLFLVSLVMKLLVK